VNDDLTAAYDAMRPILALYVGGMGAKEANFHADVFRRLGYGEAVDRIQELYLSGHQSDAVAAVPDAMVDEICLVGPPAKIRHDLEAWRESRVTSILVGGSAATLRQVAELVLG
jgi:alkanesulfonate monooxygenase SsuD/methylene tetrahydromethanopterin reductase-like flavin-dependent oxidoreductase (luciferase family)